MNKFLSLTIGALLATSVLSSVASADTKFVAELVGEMPVTAWPKPKVQYLDFKASTMKTSDAKDGAGFAFIPNLFVGANMNGFQVGVRGSANFIKGGIDVVDMLKIESGYTYQNGAATPASKPFSKFLISEQSVSLALEVGYVFDTGTIFSPYIKGNIGGKNTWHQIEWAGDKDDETNIPAYIKDNKTFETESAISAFGKIGAGIQIALNDFGTALTVGAAGVYVPESTLKSTKVKDSLILGKIESSIIRPEVTAGFTHAF